MYCGMHCRASRCTGRGKTGEYPGGMAAGAGQAGMSSGQREYAVVESGWQPPIGSMAGVAGGSKLFVMFVILFMAGVTIGWRAFEDGIDMTTGARHAGVAADQLEAC